MRVDIRPLYAHSLEGVAGGVNSDVRWLVRGMGGGGGGCAAEEVGEVEGAGPYMYGVQEHRICLGRPRRRGTRAVAVWSFRLPSLSGSSVCTVCSSTSVGFANGYEGTEPLGKNPVDCGHYRSSAECLRGGGEGGGKGGGAIRVVGP